jgi:hypothetical protein
MVGHPRRQNGDGALHERRRKGHPDPPSLTLPGAAAVEHAPARLLVVLRSDENAA